jgi:hypothetical protein
MPIKSPVLVMTFNRPDTTAAVMAEIAKAKPPKIFLFSDGARPDRPDEAELVAETRRVMGQAVTWGAEVYTRYNETNQGLFAGVSGAIDWFFSEVPEGIILEDDCVPHPDFFPYCDELLERYRNDDRVWCVSGDNSMGLRVEGGASYGFIRYPLIWGWATWRRAWSAYDRDLNEWARVRDTKFVRGIFPDRLERKVRSKVLNRQFGAPTTWDYQWSFTVLLNRGLTAVPAVNLISNIGWNRPDATHTKSNSPRANFRASNLGALVHPILVEVNRAMDREFVESGGLGLKKYRVSYQVKKWIGRARRLVGRMIGR